MFRNDLVALLRTLRDAGTLACIAHSALGAALGWIAAILILFGRSP